MGCLDAGSIGCCQEPPGLYDWWHPGADGLITLHPSVFKDIPSDKNTAGLYEIPESLVGNSIFWTAAHQNGNVVYAVGKASPISEVAYFGAYDVVNRIALWEITDQQPPEQAFQGTGPERLVRGLVRPAARIDFRFDGLFGEFGNGRLWAKAENFDTPYEAKPIESRSDPYTRAGGATPDGLTLGMMYFLDAVFEYSILGRERLDFLDTRRVISSGGGLIITALDTDYDPVVSSHRIYPLAFSRWNYPYAVGIRHNVTVTGMDGGLSVLSQTASIVRGPIKKTGNFLEVDEEETLWTSAVRPGKNPNGGYPTHEIKLVFYEEAPDGTPAMGISEHWFEDHNGSDFTVEKHQTHYLIGGNVVSQSAVTSFTLSSPPINPEDLRAAPPGVGGPFFALEAEQGERHIVSRSATGAEQWKVKEDLFSISFGNPSIIGASDRYVYVAGFQLGIANGTDNRFTEPTYTFSTADDELDHWMFYRDGSFAVPMRWQEGLTIKEITSLLNSEDHPEIYGQYTADVVQNSTLITDINTGDEISSPAEFF